MGIHWILWWLTPGQWFKPYLNGNVTDANSGSRIELTGGTPIPVKLLWVLILLGVSGLIAVWTIFSYPYNISHDPAHSGNDLLAGIVLLSLLSGLLVLLPIVGWLQTRFHLADILNELQRHLDLRTGVAFGVRRSAFNVRPFTGRSQDARKFRRSLRQRLSFRLLPRAKSTCVRTPNVCLYPFTDPASNPRTKNFPSKM